MESLLGAFFVVAVVCGICFLEAKQKREELAFLLRNGRELFALTRGLKETEEDRYRRVLIEGGLRFGVLSRSQNLTILSTASVGEAIRFWSVSFWRNERMRTVQMVVKETRSVHCESETPSPKNAARSRSFSLPEEEQEEMDGSLGSRIISIVTRKRL